MIVSKVIEEFEYTEFKASQTASLAEAYLPVLIC
jgi:hypothetical protein